MSNKPPPAPRDRGPASGGPPGLAPASGGPPGLAPASGGPPGSSFEETIKRLTGIVEALEEGELSLEESLRLFEEGVKLSRLSQDKLDRAQKRVEELLRVDEQGRARTQPFETSGLDPTGGGPPDLGEDDDGPYEP